MTGDNLPEILTVSEVAALLRLHPHTVQRQAREGKIECFQTAGGHYRFRREDIRKLISANRA